MNIHGKVVVITGASSGIGAAAARAFAAAGARVVLAARGERQLRALAEEIGGLAVPTNVASRADTDALVARACKAFGGIDVLVNNAGVGIASPVGAIREEDMLAALRVNVLGPLALTQAALPSLRARGGQVIFVSSVVGLRALPYLGGYAATKAALDRLTEALRVELRGSGVAVTLARPGTTSTRFTSSRLGHGHERRRMSSRAVTPEQVARALVRAAQRRPRVMYTALGDRLNIAFSLLTPSLTDRLLGWAFEWEE